MIKNASLKDKILLGISAAILLTVAVFLIFYWHEVYDLLERMLTSIELVEDYIKSFGILGIIIMMIIIVICFFFPVLSSMPIQIACGITYGFWKGSLIVWIAMFIATQLLYLFRANMKVFYSKQHIEKRERIEKMVQESDRNIYVTLIIAYLLPGVPFLVINNIAASGLKYRQYIIVTALGMIPDVFTTLFIGEKLLSSSPIASIISLIAIIILIVLSIVFKDKIVTWIFAKKKKKSEE